MNNSKELIEKLDNLMSKLKEKRKYFKNEKTNFTRNRKLNFETVIYLLMCMESGSLKDELYKYFGLNKDNPTSSALIQQRDKIKLEAFEWLLKEFNKVTIQNKTYKGYRLLAVDGSSIPISYDENDKETYIDLSPNKGHNRFHLNAMYDLLEHTYEDIIIQGEANNDENGAFNTFVDRYNGDNAIFIADRCYESYNSFVHVMNSNQKFLIRVKDISSNGILSALNLKDGVFDLTINRILTLKQTKDVKNNPDKFRFMPKKSTFDFMDKSNPYYDIKFRTLRFKLDNGKYECIITNLSKEEFTVDEIKDLYNKRWGIETSFRELKYAVGMSAFHSKRRDFIKQEIYLRILFYNFSERIIRKRTIKFSDKKYLYQLNFTRAFHIIKIYLIKIKSGFKPPDVESIIEKEIEPVRFGRSSPRNVRNQTPVFFIYR